MARNFRIEPFSIYGIHELPDQIPAKANVIVNLMGRGDPETSGGTHWVCLHNHPQQKHVIYFDSFGVPIDPRLLKFSKSSGKRLLSSTSHIQNVTSANCGSWCIHILDRLNRGESFVNIILDFDSTNQKLNEKELFS